MTDEEIRWLEVCVDAPKKYSIVVDNDCVFVVDSETGNDVFDFNNFGWRMVIDLLRYIGCNAEEA